MRIDTHGMKCKQSASRCISGCKTAPALAAAHYTAANEGPLVCSKNMHSSTMEAHTVYIDCIVHLCW